MFLDEILTTTDNVLLISCLIVAEEVDGRDAALPGKGVFIVEGVSPEVVVEEENRGEEEECQQCERISGITPKERHDVGRSLRVRLRC